MNNLDKTYTDLLQDILDNGVEKKDRTGTGTLSVFGRQIRHKMSEGFPLLTTKKMAWKTIVTELLWFLKGDTNIKYLVDNGCNIWNGDAYKNYVNKQTTEDVGSMNWFIEQIKTDNEFAKKWGELGPIYGKQWRSWQDDFGPNKLPLFPPNNKIDQIANLINDLKTNPDSRRLMVNAWNVGELDQMVLPPCHFGFQVYTRELSYFERYKLADKKGHEEYGNKFGGWYLKDENKESNINDWNSKNVPTRAISLMWNQRSVDTFLGLPFNIASYGLLLEIIAKEVNMVPDELIGNLGDVHLYSNHIEQAKEQIGSELSIEERVNLANDNDINISFKFGDYNFLEEKLDKLDIPKRTREPYPLPTLNIFEPVIGKKISILDNLHIWSPNCFIIENYQSHPTIKAPLSN